MRKDWGLIVAVLVLGRGSDDELTPAMPNTQTHETQMLQVVISLCSMGVIFWCRER